MCFKSDVTCSDARNAKWFRRVQATSLLNGGDRSVFFTRCRGGGEFVPVDERNCMPLVILCNVVFYTDLNHILEEWLDFPSPPLILRIVRHAHAWYIYLYRVIRENPASRERPIPRIWSFCGGLALHGLKLHSRRVSRRSQERERETEKNSSSALIVPRSKLLFLYRCANGVSFCSMSLFPKFFLKQNCRWMCHLW